MYVHTIALPEDISSLRLRLEPVFPGTPAALNDVVIEEGADSLSYEPAKKESKGKVYESLYSQEQARIVGGSNNLGGGLIEWAKQCYYQNEPYPYEVMEKEASETDLGANGLIFLPYPALSFFASVTGNRRAFPVPASLVLCLANFGLQVFLTHRGVSDYYYLVYISHGHIALAFLAVALLLIRAIRLHTIQKELLRSLIIGISACAIGAGLDIGRYYYLQSYGFTGYTRLGVLVFTLMMGIYLFREQTRSLRLKQHENSLLISEITTAFAKVIDMKDSYTNGHSFRVAQYTSMLAKELGYDDETVERYYRIALLHDVGKIGIPKVVLNKPGKLTDEEYEIIKSHTSKGYDVLKDISIMPELAVGAQSHHERPDGKGYPNHLKGDEIPRVAQIIAVADCFDAMYSNRPYRKRMNFEKAVSIIREVSGTQLTPDVVEAFLRLVDKGEFRAPDDDGGGSTENIENIRNK